MSSFMRKGQREQTNYENKIHKKHLKSFYRIMGEMNNLSKTLLEEYPNIEFTEENIDSYVKPIYGRELDSMEKFLVLGKLYHGENNT